MISRFIFFYKGQLKLLSLALESMHHFWMTFLWILSVKMYIMLRLNLWLLPLGEYSYCFSYFSCLLIKRKQSFVVNRTLIQILAIFGGNWLHSALYSSYPYKKQESQFCCHYVWNCMYVLVSLKQVKKVYSEMFSL